MIGLLRSEMFKLRTTRTMLGLALGMVAVVLLTTIGNGLGPDETYLWDRDRQFGVLASSSFAAAIAAIVGLMAMTTEFRHGTIRPTFLASPRRTRVVAAKIVASTVVGAALGILGVGLSYPIGRLILDARDIPNMLSSRDVALVIVGPIAAAALWGAMGAGLGAAIRNQVGAIVGLLIWILFVENILFALFPVQARYLPGAASNALTQMGTPHLLHVLPGTLIFVAYIAAAAVVGAIVTLRRDVS